MTAPDDPVSSLRRTVSGPRSALGKRRPDLGVARQPGSQVRGHVVAPGELVTHLPSAVMHQSADQGLREGGFSASPARTASKASETSDRGQGLGAFPDVVAAPVRQVGT